MINVVNLNKDELERIDAWRGILVLMIASIHAQQLFLFPYYGLNMGFYIWGQLANASVLAFFFISGLVIIMSLIINFNKNDDKVDLKHYLYSRISRIYPPLIATMIICYIIKFILFKFNMLGSHQSFLLPGEQIGIGREYFMFSRYDVIEFLKMNKLGFEAVDPSLWTLIIEWWMYFFGLFVFMLFTTKKIGLRLFYIVMAMYMYSKIESNNSYAPVYVSIWVLGGIYLFAKEYRKHFNIVLILLGIIGLCIAEFGLHIFSLKKDITTQPVVQFSSILIFAGTLFYLPKIKFLQKIGHISYTLYIIHFPIYLLIFSLLHVYSYKSPMLLFLLFFGSIAVVIAISLWLSKIIENKNLYYNLLKKYF